MHYSCVIIILFSTDLYKSELSTYSFENLVFLLPVFCIFCLFRLNSMSFLDTYNIWLIYVYVTKSPAILFSPYINYL